MMYYLIITMCEAIFAILSYSSMKELQMIFDHGQPRPLFDTFDHLLTTDVNIYQMALST